MKSAQRCRLKWLADLVYEILPEARNPVPFFSLTVDKAVHCSQISFHGRGLLNYEVQFDGQTEESRSKHFS